MAKSCHDFHGLDTAAQSREQQSLQLAPRLRQLCAGITFEGRVALFMENWKPIEGYEGFYEVSDLGRVRAMFDNWNGRYKSGRIIKPQNNGKGYMKVGLFWPIRHGKAKQRTVHSLVLETFSGPQPKGKEVRHRDGTRNNNRLDNLQWGTRKENMGDAVVHGTLAWGEATNLAKLTRESVIEIRALFDSGVSTLTIGNRFGIHRMQAFRIGKRTSWSRLPEAT